MSPAPRPSDDDRQRLGPAARLGAGESVDETEEPGRHRDHAGKVDARALRVGLVDQQDHRADRGRDREQQVDVQAPAPREHLGEDAPEQQADRRPAAGDRAEDPEGLAALVRIGERRRQQRQRRGSQQGAERALQGARRDQDAEGLRGAAECRRDREPEQADHERPLAPEQVRDAPAEEQEAPERERVRRDDPLAVLVGETQVLLRRRQRDVHDRRVEDHHQLRDPEHRQDRPPAIVMRARRALARVRHPLRSCHDEASEGACLPRRSANQSAMSMCFSCERFETQWSPSAYSVRVLSVLAAPS